MMAFLFEIVKNSASAKLMQMWQLISFLLKTKPFYPEPSTVNVKPDDKALILRLK